MLSTPLKLWLLPSLCYAQMPDALFKIAYYAYDGQVQNTIEQRRHLDTLPIILRHGLLRKYLPDDSKDPFAGTEREREREH